MVVVVVVVVVVGLELELEPAARSQQSTPGGAEGNAAGGVGM